MASTKFFLDLRGKAKDGKGSVLIRLYHNSTTTTFCTGVRVYPENWTGFSVTNVSGYAAINAKLNEQKTQIDKQLAFMSLEPMFNSYTASQLKTQLQNDSNTKVKFHPIKDIVEDYINGGSLAEGTKKIYVLMLGKVTRFSGESFCMEFITLKWLREFDKFLSRTQGANGKAIYLRALRTICNYARHSEIEMPYPFDSFSIKYEETVKRSITVEDLRNLYYFKTTKENEVYRDYFFLMFFLIGINSKDLLLAKKTQLVNGRLEYIRAKTKKKYSVKVEPEAMGLLNKYAGRGDYLLEAMEHCQHYESFRREINEGLQSIGTTVKSIVPVEDDLFAEPIVVNTVKPIIPEITTYYARHTWATFAHKLGISSDIIALALGHSQANRVTFIYIKPDMQKVDEANRKVIDYFFDISKSQ